MMKYIHIEVFSNDLSIKFKMDILKIFQSILSKQLPPERSQGIMNLLYICFYTDATTEEIESALVMSDAVNRTYYCPVDEIHLR